MTEKESLMDEAREPVGDSPHVHQAPERRRWTYVTKHFRSTLVVPPIPIPGPDSAPESCARRST